MFVGKDRQAALGELLAAWRFVLDSRSPLVVSISGEPGMGKTRIVQEFYRAVMREHNASGFWPASIGTDTAGDHSESAIRDLRKAVRPDAFVPPVGSNPDVLWIGTALPDVDGFPYDSGLDDVIDQLSRVLASMIRVRDRRMAMGKLLFKVLGLWPAEPLIELTIAGLDLAGSDLAKAFRRDSQGGAVSMHAQLDEKLAAFYRTLIDLWDVTGLDGPPTILVIEDAHVAQAPTIKLIERILTSAQLPFLIVLCSQAEALKNSPAMMDLLRDGGDRVRSVELDRLDEDAMESIVRDRLPNSSQAVVRAISEKADGNPYHARLILLTLNPRITEGTLDAKTAEIEALSSSFETILARLWDSLPDSRKEVLGVLSVVGYQAPLSVDDAILRLLNLADVDTGWIRRSSYARSFLELARWELAARRTSATMSVRFRSSIVSAALTAIEGAIERASPHDEPSTEQVAAVRRCLAHIVPNAKQLGLPIPSSFATVLVRWATELRWEFRYTDALAVLDLSDMLPRPNEGEVHLDSVLEGSRLRATCVRIMRGRGTPEAIEAAETCITLASAYPTRRYDEMRSWVQLSRATRITRHSDPEMLKLSREALDVATSIWESTDQRDDEARRDLLSASYPWFSRSGDRRRAAELAFETGQLARQLFGPDHPHVLEAMTDRANYLLRVDRPAGIAAYREVLEKKLALWGGMNHPTVARSARNLASALLREGDEESVHEAMEYADAAHLALSSHFGVAALSPAVSKGICAQSRVALARFRPDDADQLRRSALALAADAYELERARLPQGRLWAIREHLAEARAAMGDDAGLSDFEAVLAERSQELAHPERRAEVRWSAERLAKLYTDRARFDDARDIQDRFRLLDPDDHVLGPDDDS